MLKMESFPMTASYGGAVARVGKCNINLGRAVAGEARVNLPLELSLPADPIKWSKREAQNWLCWLREANDLDRLDITSFNVDGPGLCSLSPHLIEEMVGVRASNIFRSTLDLLQSTAALVRQSPTAEEAFRRFGPGDTVSSSPGVAPASPALTLTPSPSRSQDRLAVPLHYQTPGELPSFNRSSVITAEDIARLQPVAEDRSPGPSDHLPGPSDHLLGPSDHLSLLGQYSNLDHGTPAAKIEGRRSSDSSIEGEEDKLNRKYFPVVKTERKSSSNSIDCGRQGVTLWQFILELLADESCQEILAWTENYLEFKVVNSKEMAARWGRRKNRPRMNYDKLSRALRYYYRKNLIQHVPGKRQVYFFVEHPESLDFTQLLTTALATHPIRNRKQSAFTHVQNTNNSGSKMAGIKRTSPTRETIISEMKKVRGLDQPLSMLSYHRGPLGGLSQMLNLHSPFTHPIPKLTIRQGGADMSGTSAPRRTLEELMLVSTSTCNSANSPALMTSFMAPVQAQIPPHMIIPGPENVRNIPVLDNVRIRGVF